MKLGQTLKCFALEKSLPDNKILLNQSIKIPYFQGPRILTVRENQQLGRLTDFYQS
jgi:hypothetical protein